MLGSCLDGRVTGCSGVLWLEIRSCYGHRGRAAPVYSVVLWVILLDDGWGYGHVFRTGNMFRLGIRPRFRHLRVAFVGRMLLRPYTCYMPYIEIRSCFPNRGYVSVGDTAVFSPPTGGVCGAYSIRPYTCYMPPIEIRTRFPNRGYISVGDTEMFSEPGTRYPSKYEGVFRTGHK